MNRLAIGGAVACALIGALFVLLFLPRSSPGPRSDLPQASAPIATPTAALVSPDGMATVVPRSGDGGSAAPLRRSAETRLARLLWGNARDQVGRRGDPEAAAEGPMALAVGRDGTLLLLDQVNARVLRRDKAGHFGAPLAIGAESAQDLRAGPQGGIVVLDRLGQKALSRFDAEGKLIEEQPLASIGVLDPGGTTGLYEDGGGVLYVEESLKGEGRRVLRPIAGGDPLPGRPSRDGSQLLAAAIVDRSTGRLVVRGLERTGAARWETPLSVDRTILGIVLCDSDERGDVYVAVLHAERASGSHDLTDERMELFRLRADGRPVSRHSVPHPPSELESFRELTIADVGILWWMHPLPDGSGVAIEELNL